MKDSAKTLIAVVAAVVLVGLVWVTRPAPATVSQFSDAGQEFFPAFTDPLKARSLEVVAFDEPTASYLPFKVEFDGKKWVIPSHNNYPADAESNMAEAATVFIGLKKEQVVADSATRHQELGVLAPDDEKAPLSGRGTRVTIKDESGSVLSELIIGLEQKTPEGAPTGKRYARVPGKNRVYAVTIAKGLTTRFADWVQTDLMRVTGKIDRVTIDNYRIDEKAGKKVTTEIVTLQQKMQTPPAASPDAPPPAPRSVWTLEAEPGGPPGPGEVVNEERVTQLTDGLRGLRIAGVRPKPPKLAEYFGGGTGAISLDPLDIMAMQSRGFYVTQDGQFLANEGQLEFEMDDGIEYTMYFGEVLYGEGETLSAGKNERPGSAGGPGGAGPVGDVADAKSPSESRFAFVNVRLNESRLPKPPEAPKPPVAAPTPSAETTEPAPAPEPTPAPGGAKNDDEPPAAAEPAPAPAPATGASATSPPAAVVSPEQQAYEEAKKTYERQLELHERRVKAIRDRAQSLQKSFAPWYYLIDAETFRQIRASRAELVKPEEPAPPATILPPGAEGGMGLPPGVQMQPPMPPR